MIRVWEKVLGSIPFEHLSKRCFEDLDDLYDCSSMCTC